MKGKNNINKSNGVIEMAGQVKTLTYSETMKTMLAFYEDCFKFWQREGLDNIASAKKALVDVISIERDPFSPSGSYLDGEAKDDFHGIVKSFL